MELIKSAIKFELTEAFRPWLDLRGLLRAASGNPAVEIQGQAITVDRADIQQRAIVEVRALTIQQEGRLTPTGGSEALVEAVATFNENVALPPIKSLRFDVIYIEPYPLPFHELVDRFKQTLTRSNPLTEPAVDVGLVLDYRDDDVIRHLQIGPMEPVQLQSTFLIWPREGLPEQFIFASLGYVYQHEMEFDRRALTQILQTASRWQQAQAETIRDTVLRV